METYHLSGQRLDSLVSKLVMGQNSGERVDRMPILRRKCYGYLGKILRVTNRNVESSQLLLIPLGPRCYLVQGTLYISWIMLLWYGPCGTLPRGAKPRYLLMLDVGRFRVPNCYGCGGHRNVHRDTNRLSPKTYSNILSQGSSWGSTLISPKTTSPVV